jgi:hypothetical protein
MALILTAKFKNVTTKTLTWHVCDLGGDAPGAERHTQHVLPPLAAMILQRAPDRDGVLRDERDYGCGVLKKFKPGEEVPSPEFEARMQE